MLPLDSSSVARMSRDAANRLLSIVRFFIVGVVLRHTSLDSGSVSERAYGPVTDGETQMCVVATRDGDVPRERQARSWMADIFWAESGVPACGCAIAAAWW